MTVDYKMNESHAFQVSHKKGVFGIEVEVEGNNLPTEDHKALWKVTKDGSLRGEANEYILKRPLELGEAKFAVEHLGNLLANSQLHMSFRTSVHVHINIQNMYITQLKRFIYVSFLLENLLAEFSGEGRVGNRFCLRVCDAEYQIAMIKACISAAGTIPRFMNEECKYAAINLVPIRTQGSVEFRTMQGTTDSDTINTWLEILNKIYKFALSDSRSCKELSDLVVASPSKFLEEVMGELSNLLKFKGYEEAIKESEELLFAAIADEVVYDRKAGEQKEAELKQDVQKELRNHVAALNAWDGPVAPYAPPALRKMAKIIMDDIEPREIDLNGPEGEFPF